jgi:hypothetical protein
MSYLKHFYDSLRGFPIARLFKRMPETTSRSRYHLGSRLQWPLHCRTSALGFQAKRLPNDWTKFQYHTLIKYISFAGYPLILLADIWYLTYLMTLNQLTIVECRIIIVSRWLYDWGVQSRFSCCNVTWLTNHHLTKTEPNTELALNQRSVRKACLYRHYPVIWVYE